MAEILVTRPEYLERLKKLQEQGNELNNESFENIITMLNYMTTAKDELTLDKADSLLEDNQILIDAQQNLRSEIEKIKINSVLEKCGVGDCIVSYVPYFKYKDISVDYTISRVANISNDRKVTFVNYYIKQKDIASDLMMSAMKGTNFYTDEEMESMMLNAPLYGEIEFSDKMADGSPNLESYILTKAETSRIMGEVFLRCPVFENIKAVAKYIDEIIFPGRKEEREVAPDVC